jgi:hypothetical protein
MKEAWMHDHCHLRSLEQMRNRFKLSQTSRISGNEFIMWRKGTTTMPHLVHLKAGMYIMIQACVVWSS